MVVGAALLRLLHKEIIMTKLTDPQSILLSTASRRENLSVLPLPDALRAGGAVSKAIASLIRRALVEERTVNDKAAAHRVAGDVHVGLFITARGLAAIGIESPENEAAAAEQRARPDPPLLRMSKTTAIIALLEREGGATIAELIAATGWLPHTTRAALSGLRKKGHVLERTKRADSPCYRIAGAAA